MFYLYFVYFRKVGLLDIEAKDGMADMEWKFLETKTKAEVLKELEDEINLIFSDILTINSNKTINSYKAMSSDKTVHKRQRHISSAL